MIERVLAVALVTAVGAGAGLVLVGPAFLAAAVQVWLIVAVIGFGAVFLFVRFQTFSNRIEVGTGSRSSLAGVGLLLAMLTAAAVTACTGSIWARGFRSPR